MSYLLKCYSYILPLTSWIGFSESFYQHHGLQVLQQKKIRDRCSNPRYRHWFLRDERNGNLLRLHYFRRNWCSLCSCDGFCRLYSQFQTLSFEKNVLFPNPRGYHRSNTHFPAYCSSVVHFGGLAAEKWTFPASTELPSSSCAYGRHCPRSASPGALSKELIPFFSACIECFPLKYCCNKCAVGLAGLLLRLTRERIAIPLIPSYYLQNASKVSTHIDDCFVQQTEWLMTERKTRSLIMVIDLMFALTSRELKSHAYAKIKAFTSFANW